MKLILKIDIPTFIADPDFVARLQLHLIAESKNIIWEKIEWYSDKVLRNPEMRRVNFDIVTKAEADISEKNTVLDYSKENED